VVAPAAVKEASGGVRARSSRPGARSAGDILLVESHCDRMGDDTFRRRTVLAGFAAALAGCSGQSGDGATTSEATDATARATTTRTETETTERTTTEQPTTEEPIEVREWPDSYYQGPMVSAHEHMNGPDGYSVVESDLSGFVKWMDRNRVAQVMAIASDWHMDTLSEHDDRFVPFAFGYMTMRNEFDTLADAFAERLDRYAYDGIGEIGLKGQLTPDGEPPVPADHPEMMAMYEVAAEYDAPVMLHTVSPWRYEGGEDWDDPSEYPPFQQLDHAMREHRDTDFLVHESYEWSSVPDDELVAEKLDEHPNLYYDISATAPKLMYGQGSFTREEFESVVDEDRVAAEVDRLYEKYDAANEWHYEDWALNTFLDIARGILGRLPEADARNVAYRTAEDLFDIEVDESSV
jgi:predicted TIM-barrel fold metal-dependent hydrolase